MIGQITHRCLRRSRYLRWRYRCGGSRIDRCRCARRPLIKRQRDGHIVILIMELRQNRIIVDWCPAVFHICPLAEGTGWKLVAVIVMLVVTSLDHHQTPFLSRNIVCEKVLLLYQRQHSLSKKTYRFVKNRGNSSHKLRRKCFLVAAAIRFPPCTCSSSGCPTHQEPMFCPRYRSSVQL